MNQTLNAFQNRIGYRFREEKRLQTACTHASVGEEAADNQRLEFLGDAVLGLVIAEALYNRFPGAQEGALDHMRASIVNGRSLTKIARELNLGGALIVSEAHRQHLPEPSDSMLEDALEAVIGAIYQDGGLDAARHCILSHFDPLLQSANPDTTRQNPKGRLQEWTQKHHQGATPIYKEIGRHGPDHDRIYTVEVQIEGHVLGHGQGSSIKEAERLAAQSALRALMQN